MVSQGQAVARLNTLAFVFLPMSYVAVSLVNQFVFSVYLIYHYQALFGMTNFSISAKWYPLGAIITLLFVLLFFFLSDQFPKWHVRCLAKGSTKREATPVTGEATSNAVKAAKFPNDDRPSISNAATSNTITAQPSSPTPDPTTNRKLNFLHRLNPYSRRRAVFEMQSLQLAPETPYGYKISAPIEPSFLSVPLAPVTPYDYKISAPIEPSVLSVGPNPKYVQELPLEGTAFQPSLQVPYDTTVLPPVYSMGGESSSTTQLIQTPAPSTSWPFTSESQGGMGHGFDP